MRRDVVRAAARAARQGAALDEILARDRRVPDSAQAIAVGASRWTTPEMLELERPSGRPRYRPGRAESPGPNPDAVTAALSSRPSLSAEQARMAEQLTLSGRPVEVVIGHPGTGKTFTLDAVREAFEASGHQVIGVSLAARAARELQAGSGIVSTTAHALQAALDSGRLRLGEGDVLVCRRSGHAGDPAHGRAGR